MESCSVGLDVHSRQSDFVIQDAAGCQRLPAQRLLPVPTLPTHRGAGGPGSGGTPS